MTTALSLAAGCAAVLLCMRLPAVGMAAALAAGRQSVLGVPVAVPLLLAAALGLLMARRPPAPALRQGLLAGALAASVGWGLLVASFRGNETFATGVEKGTLTLVCTVPLVLLSGVLVFPPERRRFYAAVVVLYVGLGLLAVAGVGAGATPGDGRRISALGGGPITLAQGCAAAAIVCLFAPRLLRRCDMRTEQLVRSLIAAALAGTAVLTGSRAPVLALLVVVLLGVLTAGGQGTGGRVRRTRARLLLGAATLVLSGAFAVNVLGPGSRFDLLRNPSAELERSRLDLWREGWHNMASAGPAGSGLGSFAERRLPSSLASFGYPHNLVLEALSEIGWVLGGALVLLLVGALLHGRRAPDRTPMLLGVFYLMATQTSGDLFNSRYVFFYAAMASALAGRSASPRGRAASNHSRPGSSIGTRQGDPAALEEEARRTTRPRPSPTPAGR